MWRKLLFFGVLYFVQGAALAYVINFQKPFLAQHGISKETLGLFTSLLLIPFIAKVFLGYLSDRWPVGRWGSRKPYMFFGLGLFAFCYAGLSALNPGKDFPVFAALTWFASLGLAWFDTCADGWAVDAASESEQGPVQAAMIAGKSLGLVLMSAAFGHVAQRYGFGVIFQFLAALALAVLILVLMVPHKTAGVAHSIYIKSPRDLMKPFYLFFALFGVAYSVASFGTDGLLTLFLSETRGAGALEIGYFGMSRGCGALCGAVLFAFAQRSIGLKRAAYLAIVLVAFGCLMPRTSLPALALGVLWGMAWGFQETAFVTLAMRFAQGPWAATLFAASMIFSNVGTSVGEALGAPNVPAFGYDGVFTGFALIALGSSLLLPPVLKKAD